MLSISSDDWENASHVYIEEPEVLKVGRIHSIKEKASVRNHLQIVLFIAAVYFWMHCTFFYKNT